MIEKIKMERERERETTASQSTENNTSNVTVKPRSWSRVVRAIKENSRLYYLS